MKFTTSNRVFMLGLMGCFVVATLAVLCGLDHASAHQGIGFMADAAAVATLDKKTVEDLAAEVKSQFQKSHDAVKEIAEKALAEAAKGLPLANTAKELAD